MSDFSVVWGVLRVILSGQIRSEGCLIFATRNPVVCGVFRAEPARTAFHHSYLYNQCVCD